jgi:hypothetical protein
MFSTNMTSKELIASFKQHQMADLREAESWLNTYQARVDKLRRELDISIQTEQPE